MRARPAKIKCEGCGKRHDERRLSPGLCARCSDKIAVVNVEWSVEDFLATIEKPTVRASYKSYLKSVSKLTGTEDWAAIDASTVDHLARTHLPAKAASSVRSAWKSFSAWAAANTEMPKPCGRVTPPPALEEVLNGLVRVDDNLFFKATMKQDAHVTAPTVKSLDDFEMTFLS